MGVCWSKKEKFEGFIEDEEEYDDEERKDIIEGDCKARVRLKGSCRFAAMFTKQGKKGVNQDAMTVWEDLNSENDEDNILCTVFDGHGPSGHKVACYVRDSLPLKLFLSLKSPKITDRDHDDADVEAAHDNGDDGDKNKDNNEDDDDDGNANVDSKDNDNSYHPSFLSHKATFIKAFKDMDNELRFESTVDSVCSGATAVSVLKQGKHLTIANLGDSRAVLCTRNKKNRLVPVQLTVDLKPDVPSEAERIKSSQGRIFALEQEPDVYRLWLPDEDCPGLAMARAFGDFCLKDYGLISIPQVSYRKITDRDEFVVLATDGVWDVLSNKEVVKIVASSRKRSMAAKLLVDCAVRAWRNKYPSSKVDDCAVICLFLTSPNCYNKSISQVSEGSTVNHLMRAISLSSMSRRSTEDPRTDDTITSDHSEWNALEGLSRINSIVKLPRFSMCFD